LRPTGLLEPVALGWSTTRLDVRRWELAERVAGLATRIHDHREYVGLEHLPADAAHPRWGHGAPPHPALQTRISAHRPAYDAFVADIAALHDDLVRIDVLDRNESEPCWRNSWFPGLDTAALYATVRSLRPRRYLEVGSGYSTRVVARAARDGGLDTEIVSIDPAPRASIDALCSRVVRMPVEQVPLQLWEDLRAGDVVFFDGSHRALMQSDATVFFLEVLPSLPHGVRVGVHDILLPDDYFPSWAEYLWSEQYLLAAYLLAEAPWIRPVFAAYWSSVLSDATAPLDGLWSSLGDQVDRRGWSFWFDIDRPGA
jgi:hypothetical protein